MHLEASTKPHVHQKFQIFWTNIAFTMACPNFKNGPKNGLGPLGVNTTFRMTHFLKSYYNVFILENKINAQVFRRTCVNLCYILLEIALICVNLERVSF
jgi:hypothetical protein